jgi:hypothetical protein
VTEDVPVVVGVAVDATISFRTGMADFAPPAEEFMNPPETVTFDFCGRQVTWHEHGPEHFPTVFIAALDRDDTAPEEELLSRFLSAVAFKHGVALSISTGPMAWPADPGAPPMLRQDRRPGDLRTYPEPLGFPDDEHARLALALWREGQSQDSPFAAFLSFWKAVEVAQGKRMDEWLVNNAGHDDKELVSQLRDRYRDAVAHGRRDRGSMVVANPDRPSDVRRMVDAVGLMRSLSWVCIQQRWPQTLAIKP